MLKQFFADKSWAQRLMLAAIALNFLSQFLLYSDGSSARVTHTDYFGNVWLVLPDGYGRATGWDLHLHAYAVLLVLAICFARDDVPQNKLFGRFGWWLAALALLWACLPTALDVWGFGTMWGFVSVGIALIAAFMNGRDRKRVVAASAPPAATPK